ncbi:MAG TPA: hypothetical protein EYP56_21205 [Planctomycetaceae bacterium]|nr:hypothetical protein [Planctomycetaceae bacterium]HIQ21014.1 hypothetical protein [Planctomycetota bacterium]
MSMFGDDHYRWRETYFVLIESRRRPKLRDVEEALKQLDPHFCLQNAAADDAGRFESITVLAPDDYAALDICYTEGEEVAEHRDELMKELLTASSRGVDRARLEKIRRCDARLDVLHFEQIPDAEEEEDSEEMLDPSALLIVLNGLAKLTHGVAVDPQSGTLL